MYRRILVPTDLTDRTTKALEVASSIPAPGDARSHCCTSLKRFRDQISRNWRRSIASWNNKHQNRLNEILHERLEGTLPVDTEIVYEKRAEESFSSFARTTSISSSWRRIPSIRPNPMAASER